MADHPDRARLVEQAVALLQNARQPRKSNSGPSTERGRISPFLRRSQRCRTRKIAAMPDAKTAAMPDVKIATLPHAAHAGRKNFPLPNAANREAGPLPLYRDRRWDGGLPLFSWALAIGLTVVKMRTPAGPVGK